MQVYKSFITELAEESGILIAGYFTSKSWSVDVKPDKTIVTQADREAEQLIRDRIRSRFPGHGVIGEEFGAENKDAEFVWVIDPIDGTISFASGVPLFGTLIGLLFQGEPILGCIHQPVTGSLCIGDNRETLWNGQVCKVRENIALEEATLLTTDLSHIAKHQKYSGFDSLLDKVKLFRTWGDCFGYLLVAAGKADIMLDAVMQPWDILPVIPVIRGAGGVISGWQGEEAKGAQSCVAAASGLHEQVLRHLR